MTGSTPSFTNPTFRTSITHFELPHTEASDAAGPDVLQSLYFGTTASTISHGTLSDIEKQTEATTVDGGDDVVEGLSHVAMPSCSEQNQAVKKLLLSPETYTRWEYSASGAYANVDKTLGDGSVVDATPGSTGTSTDKDPLAFELEQGIGPARLNKLETSAEAQGSGVEEADDTLPNLDLTPQSVHASWPHPEKSNSEVQKAIQRVDDELDFQDLTTGSHLTATNLSAPGPFTAALADLMPGTHFCTTEDNSPPPHLPWQVSRSATNAARQTRLHECRGAIYRLMPPGRTICFGMNTESFRREGFTQHVTAWISNAALDVVREFNLRDLGITFAYKPGSRDNVFNIRYDPDLPDGTLAQAFFPSDARKKWQLGISRRGALFSGGYLHYMRNILAHEFTHILGLRHWHAGFNASERRLPSVLWPGTLDGNRDSIMNTGVHPGYLRFSQEDVWVIRKVYAATNGAVVQGRTIIDVIPHNGHHAP